MLDLIAFAQIGNWQHVVSCRGHEVMDSFAADLAVGTAASFLKAGNPREIERRLKYDRLSEIGKELNLAK